MSRAEDKEIDKLEIYITNLERRLERAEFLIETKDRQIDDLQKRLEAIVKDRNSTEQNDVPRN
jgi:uncharacterized protein HemX